ncbi:MAG TPA: tetratricopeptide repeat protein [Terriglobales bacterium]|nr:tetratricopeptide repeat protein [Terriglobales bacterium]
MKFLRPILFLLLALVAACSRDPNVRKQKYFASGKEYFERGDFRSAAIQFSNAAQIDPQFAEAHYQLARAYLNQKQWTPAFLELGRSVELQPDNYAAHADMATLLIASEQLNVAAEHTKLLLEKQPNDPQSHIVQAKLLSAQGDLAGAVKEVQRAIELAPNRGDSYLGLAVLQMKMGQETDAEPNFKKAAELDPQSAVTQLALGRYYQSVNQFAEAEAQFRHAAQIDPKNTEPRTALVRLLMAEGEKGQAEVALKQAKLDFPNDSAGYRMLGDFYFATGDTAKALAEYNSLYAAHPSDPQVKKNYIQLLIIANRLDDARRLNDEVLKANGNDTEALIYRGQIQLHDGHASDSATTLATAIKNDPDNGLAHYHLGVAFDQQGNTARAEQEWREAARLRPDLVDVQRALAALALRRGDMESLEQAGSQIIALQPGAPDGYALRSNSFLKRKQFPSAEQDALKAVDVAPQSAAGYIALGNVKFAQNKYFEAEKAYRQGLEHDAGSAEALAGLMRTYLSQQQADKAIAVANAQILKAPDNSAFYDLLGSALFNSKKDFSGAEGALKKSVALDKRNSDALVKLGQVLSAEGKVDEAIGMYQQYLQENPRDAGLYIFSGQLYELKQDWTRAQQMYQKALDLVPDNPLASNNLAAVMVRTGENLNVALSLAQAARRGMPESPDAADTLGWVYYKKGIYDSAADLFQEALKLAAKSKRPEDAGMHYHLGLAYQKTGKAALSRREFEAVLRIDPGYQDAGEVRELLAGLK